MLSSEMSCGAVRLLESQDKIHEFPGLRTEALTPQQVIDSAAMNVETKRSSTERVPMHQTVLCHTLQNFNLDIRCTYTNSNSTSIPIFHHTTTLTACLSM